MRKITQLIFFSVFLFAVPQFSFSQSCNAVNGNAYTVTASQQFDPGGLEDAIQAANADGVGGYIQCFVTTIYLSAPPTTITVDSLSIFMFSGIQIDCQFSASDPVFTFAPSASHSCVSQSIIVSNANPTIFYVTNTNDAGTGSLRQAIANAGVSNSQDQVRFNIPGMAPHTIQPLSYYSIERPLTIDGSTQPANGYTGNAPKIALDGNGVVNGCFWFPNNNFYSPFGIALYGCNIHSFATGVSISWATSITIGSATKRNVFYDNATSVGIGSSQNITIENNYVGTDTSGMLQAGNNNYGIYLTDDSNSVIKNNLVSGIERGIFILSSEATLIKGNKIGTNASGTASITNGIAGIYVQSSVNTTIGGTLAGDGNLISGNIGNPNLGVGIYSHFNTTTTVIGNKIGTDITGTLPLGNYHGIRINDANTVIGGLTASARNIISGNTWGITVEGNSALIQGNYIGTNVAGTSAIGNGGGIEIYSSGPSNVTTVSNNLISGNTGPGITTYSSNSNYQIYRNKIGVNVTGQNALPNYYGIELTNGTGGGMIGGINSSYANIISGNTWDGIRVTNNQSFRDTILNNIIGRDSAQTIFIPNNYGISLTNSASQLFISANVIAGNTSHGISTNTPCNGNVISQNQIYQNGQDGIYNLGQQNKFTHNAIGNNTGKGINNNTTGNNSIAQPVILTATSGGVTGTAQPNNVVELFYSQSANNNPQGYTWIGSVTANVSGNWNYTGAISVPCKVTATQTDAQGNTSEFSFPVPLFSLGADTTTCIGLPYIINAGSGFNSYLWNTGDTTSSISVYTTGYYSVSVTNISGCSDMDTIYVYFDPCVTMIEEHFASVNIYPNPARGKFAVEWKNARPENCWVEIMDASGRKLGQQFLTEEKTVFDISNFTPGFYILELKSQDGILKRERIIFY